MQQNIFYFLDSFSVDLQTNLKHDHIQLMTPKPNLYLYIFRVD